MRNIPRADDGLRILPKEWYYGKPAFAAPGTPMLWVDRAWTYLGQDTSGLMGPGRR